MGAVKPEEQHDAYPDDIAMLRALLTIRAVEQRLGRMVLDHLDPLLGETALHTGRGQEAVAVGVASARTKGDLLFSTHRGIAHCIAWGAQLFPLICEILGRRGGYARGRGGHMHVLAVDDDIVGTTGIVGGGLSLAVGAAWGLRHQNSLNVAVAFMGDGAANTGAFHEALNLATVWKAPVLFVCENNGYAEMTPSTAVTSVSRLSKRAAAYGMAAESVDGSDLPSVFEAARAGISHARSGNGPFFIECEVFRAGGHWLGDPQHYRDPDELERISAGVDDPIQKFLQTARVEDAHYRRISKDVDSEVDDVFERAMQSPVLTSQDVMVDDGFGAAP